MATSGVGMGPNASVAGTSSSLLLSACSHEIVWPVYAAMRAMMAMRHEFALRSPSLMGLPARMLRKSSSCSNWYIWLASSGVPVPFQVTPSAWSRNS